MARTDYLNDPAAPKANSIVPAVSVVVPDGQGRILLIRRTDNNYWSIPGGGMEPGESVRQAASREVRLCRLCARRVGSSGISQAAVPGAVRVGRHNRALLVLRLLSTQMRPSIRVMHSAGRLSHQTLFH